MNAYTGFSVCRKGTKNPIGVIVNCFSCSALVRFLPDRLNTRDQNITIKKVGVFCENILYAELDVVNSITGRITPDVKLTNLPDLPDFNSIM